MICIPEAQIHTIFQEKQLQILVNYVNKGYLYHPLRDDCFINSIVTSESSLFHCSTTL